MPRDNQLTLDIIIETAIQTLQKEGLGGLSMRQLAGALDVTPTALYHHVRDKHTLLDLCAQAILARVPQPDPELEWPQQLRTLILEQQRVFVRFPGLARFLLVHRESSLAALQWAEAILDVLYRAGFRGEAAMRMLMSLSFLINPITLIDDKGQTRKSNRVLSRARVGGLVKKNPGKLPRMAELLPHLEGVSYETHFAIALDQVIAGIERAARSHT
jgi:AcrR family transcriptional regulator